MKGIITVATYDFLLVSYCNYVSSLPRTNNVNAKLSLHYPNVKEVT